MSILAPGFIDGIAQTGLLLRQRLAELKDRHPSVIEEIRGEGLMVGIKTRVAEYRFRCRGACREAFDDRGRR